jgi:hypothetical protein
VTDKDLTRSTSTDVTNFLAAVKRVPAKTSRDPGRLLFAMDATLSRAPTWDVANHIQNEMFDATANLGGLSVQLCYYKGFKEFVSSAWCSDGEQLHKIMSRVRCAGGQTQIERTLKHALQEHQNNKISALVFVGDAMEENADQLCELAGRLGLMRLPIFIFQEGQDNNTRTLFKELARLSGGAYAPFNLSSADELKALLAAVAVYAAGGPKALVQLKDNKAVKLLTQQLKD